MGTMGKMVVAQLVRLAHKNGDGEFEEKKGAQVEVRNRAIVSEETVEQFKKDSKLSGLLYIVNEKLTKERDELIEKEEEELAEKTNPDAAAKKEGNDAL